jgi:hypothetical protein
VLKDAIDAVRLGIVCCALVVAGIHTYEASIGGLQNERSAGQAITKIEPSLQSLGQVRDPTQEAVARYTYWLTLFTAVLAASTIALWWTTKASVNTLAGAERAYVKMSHKAPGLDFFEERYISVTLVVTNFGRTPAKVADTLLKPVLTPAGECLPDAPNYSRDRGMPSSKAFLVANDHFINGENFVFEPDTLQKLQDSELWLYLIGYVDYVYAFGGRYRSGYARRYELAQDKGPKETRNNLVLVANDAYTYDRARRLGEGQDWD